MTKTPKEIAIEVFEKGEDGMTPIPTRLEIAASLGIAEGRRELATKCFAILDEAIYNEDELRDELSKLLNRETEKEATKTK